MFWLDKPGTPDQVGAGWLCYNCMRIGRDRARPNPGTILPANDVISSVGPASVPAWYGHSMHGKA